jgi:murein L,D-transpeptidase YcbB/YkuD
VAAKTVLTRIHEDSTYIASNDFEVFSDWGRDATLVEPASIDWSLYTESDFPFRLRQRPGPENALGKIKFMFPNRFAIYLHDSPGESQFRKWDRRASHGCIRVSDPYRIADFVFQGDSLWTPERFRRLVHTQGEKHINVPRPIPVHLVHFTVVVREDGIYFYRDVYDVDRDLDRALVARRQLLTGNS